MFHGRLTLVRAAAVAAASAWCLTAVACSSGTPDPLASLSGTKVVAEANANAKAASSMTITGDLSKPGLAYTFHLGIEPGKGCVGTIGQSDKGSFKIIVIGTTFYMKPDATFWKSSAGSNAAAAIKLVNGRYLKGSTTDGSMSGLSSFCDVSWLFKDNAPMNYTKGKVTMLNGIRVLPINASDGSTGYVTDQSHPEFVEITMPKGAKGAKGEYGTISLMIGGPVPLTAPPASQVMNAANLGM